MGGGKGAVDHFVAVVRKGQILFEIDGIPEDVAEKALTLASRKLPVQTALVKRTSLL
ncbi:MAG: large subunit ribosomal protein L16 [Parcubacteria group bacterium Gr01-1014_106]|nr:MAG: large subunit ribosomal protein L16 [Parcubacteria group bacterium Gr01-1014_106]